MAGIVTGDERIRRMLHRLVGHAQHGFALGPQSPGRVHNVQVADELRLMPDLDRFMWRCGLDAGGSERQDQKA